MSNFSLSNEVITILDALAEKFGVVIDWTSDSVLPYLKQLGSKFVIYNVWTSIVWLLVGICIVLYGLYLIKKIKFYYNKVDNFFDAAFDNINALLGLFCIIGLILCMLIGLPMILSQIFDIVTCLTFPEKVIFEELQNIYLNMTNHL